MSWKRGPLPKDTYGWGGVVKCGDSPGMGFYFADFQGDSVVAMWASLDGKDETIPANMVAFYDNSLTLPPSE